MPVDTRVIDGGGTELTAVVDDVKGLRTTVHPAPPFVPQVTIPFRQYLTDDGTATGTLSMVVDGSSANVEYWVEAHDTNDRYITEMSFVIEGAGAKLKEFGTGPALTNGLKLHWEANTGEVVMHDAIKTNFDAVRLCRGNPPFGSAADSFRAKDVNTLNSEAFMPVLDLKGWMPPFGFKLAAGTKQRIVLTVRDDMTTGSDITELDVIAYGFDRMPVS